MERGENSCLVHPGKSPAALTHSQQQIHGYQHNLNIYIFLFEKAINAFLKKKSCMHDFENREGPCLPNLPSELVTEVRLISTKNLISFGLLTHTFHVCVQFQLPI